MWRSSFARDVSLKYKMIFGHGASDDGPAGLGVMNEGGSAHGDDDGAIPVRPARDA